MSEFNRENFSKFNEEPEGNNSENVDIYKNWTDDPLEINNVTDLALQGKFDNYELNRIIQTLDAKINELNEKLQANDSDEIREQIHDCTLAYQNINNYMSSKKTADHSDAIDLGETIH